MALLNKVINLFPIVAEVWKNKVQWLTPLYILLAHFPTTYVGYRVTIFFFFLIISPNFFKMISKLCPFFDRHCLSMNFKSLMSDSKRSFSFVESWIHPLLLICTLINCRCISIHKLSIHHLSRCEWTNYFWMTICSFSIILK